MLRAPMAGPGGAALRPGRAAAGGPAGTAPGAGDAHVPNNLYVGYIVNRTEADQTEAGNGGAPASAASGRRAAHVRDTRRALLDTARRLFTRDGFQATRTEEIVEQAGLTRGALYHHFRDKEDLFRAVHEEVVCRGGTPAVAPVQRPDARVRGRSSGPTARSTSRPRAPTSPTGRSC